MKLYKITINFKNGEKVIYVFDVDTTKDLLWHFDISKKNDKIMYFEYDLRGIKINLMDVSDIKCEEIQEEVMRDKKERIAYKKIRYLERIRDLEDSIQELHEQIKDEEARKTRVKAIDYSKEQVKGGNKSSWEAMIDRVDRYIQKLLNAIIELTEMKEEVLDLIMNVENTKYKHLLIMRYIRWYSWDYIEKKMDISQNTRLKYHTEALSDIYIPDLHSMRF